LATTTWLATPRWRTGGCNIQPDDIRSAPTAAGSTWLSSSRVTGSIQAGLELYRPQALR